MTRAQARRADELRARASRGGQAPRRGGTKGRYGLTPEAYAQLEADQGHRCALCREQFTGRPHVDHCHDSGVVRGILCPRCNQWLGRIDRAFAARIVAYYDRAARLKRDPHHPRVEASP